MSAKKAKTLATRVAALEAEVQSLRRGIPESFVRQMQTFLDAERARITDDMIHGQIRKAVEEMGVDIYDRLTHQRVRVTIHTDNEPKGIER